MKVQAIIGSPRQGHSYRVVQQIERRLAQNAETQFEYVFLSQVNLNPCRGCYICQSKGESYCPNKDDLPFLIQKMQEAIGVIFVSPVYTANVSALMKNFMDRMAFTAHRPSFLGKPAMLVATASSGTGDALKALEWFRYTGFEIVSKLGVSVWASPWTQWTGKEKTSQQIEKAVGRFERALAHPPASLSLEQVIFFYVMKTTSMMDPKFFAGDYQYHQKLPMPASWWKKALGKMVYWVMSKWMDNHITPVGKE